MREVAFDFTGETAIVTGGASGIGREIAITLGRAGASVLIADVTESSLDPDATAPTHEAIVADGGEAAFVETDVADPDAIDAVVAEARTFGGVSVMVNNAGIIDRSSLLDATPAAFERLWRVNVNGVLFGCQRAAADMIDRDDPGVMVNTASISSDLAMPDHILYDATKGAVKMITRAAATDLAPHGIRVNAVAPGFTATNLSEDGRAALQEAVANDDVIKPVPMSRAGTPGDIAPTVAYLASNATGYVTGALFHVDGGYHII